MLSETEQRREARFHPDGARRVHLRPEGTQSPRRRDYQLDDMLVTNRGRLQPRAGLTPRRVTQVTRSELMSGSVVRGSAATRTVSRSRCRYRREPKRYRAVFRGKLRTRLPRGRCAGLSPAARQAVRTELLWNHNRARQGSRDPFAVNRAGNPASDDERTEAVAGSAGGKPRTPCPVPSCCFSSRGDSVREK